MAQLGSDLQTVSMDLIKLLEQSAATLGAVAHRLDEEFANRFSAGQPNPASIIHRIRKLEQQLPKLQQQCQEIMSQKQELIDHARRELTSNRMQLQQLCHRSGAARLEGGEEGGSAYAGYTKALQEWDAAMASRSSGMAKDPTMAYSKQGLNMALAESNLA